MRRPFLLFRVDFDIPYNPRQRLATFAVPLVRKVVKQRHEFVLSERAGTARSRIVGMLLVEDLALFARICLQSFRGFVLGVSVIRHFRCGFVCGLQFALAVPAVAGAVFVPKGITHGAHRSNCRHLAAKCALLTAVSYSVLSHARLRWLASAMLLFRHPRACGRGRNS